jgi:hypothetical protein
LLVFLERIFFIKRIFAQEFLSFNVDTTDRGELRGKQTKRKSEKLKKTSSYLLFWYLSHLSPSENTKAMNEIYVCAIVLSFSILSQLNQKPHDLSALLFFICQSLHSMKQTSSSNIQMQYLLSEHLPKLLFL